MTKPLMIKMGSAFRAENHNSNATPVFIKNYAYKVAYEKSRNFIISNLNLPTILACIAE